MSKLPLSRFKVVDLTRVRAGPTAVRQLADWGAQVTMTATVEREGGEKPVCVAELVFRYYT